MLSDESLGKFTASRIVDLFTGGQGVTRFKYILEKAEEVIKKHRKDAFVNQYTQHGEYNEHEGIESFRLATGFNVKYLEQKYFPINENCGSTPDAQVEDFAGNILAPVDNKCPFSKFFEQKMMILKESKPEYQNCPKQMYFQVQMQMMSLKTDIGYLVRYLTSANVDQDGNKYEYDLPLDVRLFYKEVKKDEKVQEEILKAVEKAAEERDQLVEQLKTPFIYESIY